MGKIENIREAMHPLSEFFFHDFINYQVVSQTFDIVRNPKNLEPWQLLFHSGSTHQTDVYFIIKPLNIFSGENVFKYLNIADRPKRNGSIDVLSELSEIVKENYNKISDAFSEKNVKKTQSELQKSHDIAQNEIRPFLTMCE